ncbi:hypothetical protein [Paraburkholderia silvatlantica]|uniref:Uncharacterized protein n=1 Tax=Paraburkholderia silvatlantica TaxID=321895 RepID=A0ABR6FL05_9BURK|nr:hypothetical protein [Paraburkholderia silvatlantica]MBB2928103.1 hypothetical protein [Paraburkholderia silvatlantica]PVY31066.1 hypothetical protein C7411_11289 [Paraburkholderia silvatlantica]PXW37202.1 hypothetical protein C7413_11289 [Paraburkholderia silvatlantica]
MNPSLDHLAPSTVAILTDRDYSEELGISADLHQSVGYVFLNDEHKAELTRPLTGMSYTRRTTRPARASPKSWRKRPSTRSSAQSPGIPN